ncbi:hypothetical protein SCP_1101990 [Sparassis crispa]|uniref:DNA-directed DNA polymerase n=1 Tax=Sparassis crispa TaxID=139825 RepID=A0A401GZE4_9APHY|nr:hypothetical protein SCP_1101990 [Sparassis crispa]GBE87522.1 hypothetical protein SCP_1101990 [Sparassis crispa]
MRGVEVVLEGSSDYVRRLSMEIWTRSSLIPTSLSFQRHSRYQQSPKKAVNGHYKLLEIDLDGIFQRLLLLQEKKYAAIKVEDGGRPSTEVKGLDMKCRGYCALSKVVSQYVPDQILSGEATETVVERIHKYLTTMGESGEVGKTAQAEWAKDPDEVRRASDELKIDYEHYLAHQILPPIERLCEGTDRSRLAECLGLDASRYRNPDGAEERPSALWIR